MGRVVALTFILLLASSPLEADEENERRDSVEQYLNWFPGTGETLLVMQQEYEILAVAKTVDVGPTWLESRLSRMFDDDARKILAGSKLELCLESTTRFRFPDFPEEVRGIVNLTGCHYTYDGCHVFVFDKEASPDFAKLFAGLLVKRPGKDSLIPPARRHNIAGHETIEFVASHLFHHRPKAGRETPELGKVIDLAWAERFWITSPEPNILLVATSRDFLESTLSGIEQPNHESFSKDFDEWKTLTGNAPVWGMRHMKSKPVQGDITDPRRLGELDFSGSTFAISPRNQTATLRFLNCNQSFTKSMERSIAAYVDADAQFDADENGTLTARLDWSKLSDDELKNKAQGLAFWLQTHLGYAIII